MSGMRLKTLVGCGAAAGIAATFNAPVAGALFAAEIILGSFGVAQFSPIVISSVLATVISRTVMGNEPAFIVPKYQLLTTWELIPYVLLGFLAGVVGVAFIRVLYAAEDAFEKARIHALSKPILGGLILGAIGIQFPHIFGVGYETINVALTGGYSLAVFVGLMLLEDDRDTHHNRFRGIGRYIRSLSVLGERSWRRCGFVVPFDVSGAHGCARSVCLGGNGSRRGGDDARTPDGNGDDLRIDE